MSFYLQSLLTAAQIRMCGYLASCVPIQIQSREAKQLISKALEETRTSVCRGRARARETFAFACAQRQSLCVCVMIASMRIMRAAVCGTARSSADTYTHEICPRAWPTNTAAKYHCKSARRNAIGLSMSTAWHSRS